MLGERFLFGEGRSRQKERVTDTNRRGSGSTSGDGNTEGNEAEDSDHLGLRRGGGCELGSLNYSLNYKELPRTTLKQDYAFPLVKQAGQQQLGT
jgi:hypothetical protein